MKKLKQIHVPARQSSGRLKNNMNQASALNLSIGIEPFGLKFKFRFFLTSVLIFSFFSLFIFYIFQFNQMFGTHYLIKEYEKKINVLSQENKSLEINSSQVNSLANIEDSIWALGFEKIDKTYYIRIFESTVINKP